MYRDLSGIWYFGGDCVAQGCTEDIPCSGDEALGETVYCGTEICDACAMGGTMEVTQSENLLSGNSLPDFRYPYTLNGFVNGKTVTFSTEGGGGPPIPIGGNSNDYMGTIDGNIIRGTFSGFNSYGGVLITWSGTFTVTIRK